MNREYKMSHIPIFLFYVLLSRSRRQLSFAALQRFLSSPVCATGFHNSPRANLSQWQRMQRVPRVSAHTDNYLWHDCQLNIVPAPGLASQTPASPISLHLPESLPSIALVYGMVWLRQTTAATFVAEQTVFIHSSLCWHNRRGLNPHPVSPVSPSLSSYLSLSYSL